ncbi:hypothetical protein [Limosilactobacillus reuteri]|uniref:hypothetical protein n=1 Tax=Limosilactobacillus reuteri TaxID=1598 RepID=UPI00214AD298|nr:hypothetical protein [Limosilactobacillus reuteri]MCR1878000.1 hypothetical protein [Limosilactobacillus reuteri]
MYFDKKRNEVRNIVSNLVTTPVNKLVLGSEQVEAIKMVIEHYQEENEKAKEEIHKNMWRITKPDLPRVYIAEYTTHDDYGPLRETDVFSREEDAWAFVLKQREEGVTDISVKPRLVYLDKDRTVDIDE